MILRKFIILLLCVGMLVSFSGYAYAHDDNNHMGSAMIWIPVMAGMMYLSYYIFSRHKKDERALERLKERYSEGEISREEYLRMKKDLEE